MIIWGSKGKTKVIGRGHFYCPRCQVSRQYEHHEVGKYFTLYFIPLFQTKKLGEYIECKTCFTPFETSVLEYDYQSQKELIEGIGKISSKLDAGIPVNLMYQNLLKEGITEDAANNIMSMATGGKLMVCNTCKLVFSSKHNYCASCGKALAHP